MQWSFCLNNFGVCLSLQSWRWCLRCCSVVVSSKVIHKVEQNCTKKCTKCPKFKCNTVSVGCSACRCISVVFSSKVGREKKKDSGDSSMNAICGCGLPTPCCQSAVPGGIIYADLRGELNTHLAIQALFTQSSVSEPLLQAFPFPTTLGEVTLHPLSLACVFIYSSRGKWVFPSSCGVFLPPSLLQVFLLLITRRCCCSCQLPCLFTAHVEGGSSPSPVEFSSLHQSHKVSHSWLLGTCPRSHRSLSGLAHLVYLQFQEGFPSLPFQHSMCPTLFPVSLLFLWLITQFLFSLRVVVGLSRGQCWSGPGLSVGIPWYC
jgi:hypothetical protein